MVDLKLVSYIKENKKRGYGRDELIKILRENGWSREEIKLAYKFIEKNKKALIKKPAISYTKEKDPLLKFIDNSLNEGISEREIRLALSIKGWKQEKVNDSFKKVKFPVIVQRKEEKPQEPQKQKINFKSIIKYLFYFLVLSFILSGTSLVYLYIQGMEDYSITNVAGEELTKTCLEKDCSDMKQHAINYIHNSYMAYILVSLILSLFMLVTYGVLPYKSRILWVYNFLYFLVLAFIVYTWIMFQGV